jgi:hypothetical protein
MNTEKVYSECGADNHCGSRGLLENRRAGTVQHAHSCCKLPRREQSWKEQFRGLGTSSVLRCAPKRAICVIQLIQAFQVEAGSVCVVCVYVADKTEYNEKKSLLSWMEVGGSVVLHAPISAGPCVV